MPTTAIRNVDIGRRQLELSLREKSGYLQAFFFSITVLEILPCGQRFAGYIFHRRLLFYLTPVKSGILIIVLDLFHRNGDRHFHLLSCLRLFGFSRQDVRENMSKM